MPRVPFSPKITIPKQTFPQTVNIARAVQTLEPGAGGRTVTPPQQSPIVYANVAVSIQDGATSEQTIQGRLIQVMDHKVYTQTSVAVMNGDFILYGPRVFIVQSFQDVSQQGILFLIGCIEYITQPIG